MSLQTSAFVVVPAPLPPRSRPRSRSRARSGARVIVVAPTCAADPPSSSSSLPSNPARDLSPTDRQYLAKVQARLFNARRRAAAAASSVDDAEDPTDPFAIAHTASAESIPVLPDDLDQMEDILYDRAPSNKRQVKMFGAWLDDAVAGRKADDEGTQPDAEVPAGMSPELSVHSHKPHELSTEQAMRHASEAFANAMSLFNKGMYPNATNHFAVAVTHVGKESRLGGQYQLWLAQALDASGRKREASEMLQSLGAHGDSEVRKVSRELLFILTAPRLQLDPEAFVNIPMLDDDASSVVSQGLLMANYGPLKTALVEKPPEPHSLQWYIQKERPPKVADSSQREALLVAAAIAITLMFMAVSPHPHYPPF